MATQLGNLMLSVSVNTANINRGVKGINKSLTSMRSTLLNVAGALGIAFSVRTIVNFTEKMVDMASKLEDINSLTGVVFGDMKAKIEDFASTSIDSYGMSEYAAKKYTSTYGSILKAVGFSVEEAADWSIKLTQLAGDFASFHNVDVETAFEKIKSGVVGQYKPLSEWGKILTATNLKEYALANGIKKSYMSMGVQEKTLLRLGYLFNLSGDELGDFMRTYDSYANTAKVFKQSLIDLQTTLGSFLLPVLTPIISSLNKAVKEFKDNVLDLKKALNIKDKTFSTKADTKGAEDTSKEAIKQLFEANTAMENLDASQLEQLALILGDDTLSAEDLQDSLNGITEEITKTGKAAKKAMLPMDELNILATKNTDTDSGTKGGTGGSGGTAEEDVEDTTKKGNFLSNLFSKVNFKPLAEALDRLKTSATGLGKDLWSGLEYLWKNVLQPLGTWTINEAIPTFMDKLSTILNRLDGTVKKINFEPLLTAFGKIYTAVQPIGETLWQGLLWAYDNILEPLGLWTINDALPTFLTALSGALTVVNPILQVFGDMFLGIWNGFLKDLAIWSGSVFITALTTIGDLLSGLGTWMSENKGVVEAITTAVLLFFGAWEVAKLLAFLEYSGGVIVMFKTLADGIKMATVARLADIEETIRSAGIYLSKLIPAITAQISAIASSTAAWIASTAAKVAGTIAQVAMTVATVAWNVVAGIATAVTTAFGAAVAFLTSPITLVILAIVALIAIVVLLVKNWDTVKEAAKAVWDFLVTTFSKLASWFKEKVIDPLVKGFGKFTSAIKDAFSKVWENIKSVFGNIADWFKSTVIDPISNAFKFFGDGFKGIINSLIGFAEGFVNSFINGINFIVRAINSLSFELPDWAGGYKVGFSLPTLSNVNIPRLAQGAVIPPNSEFLAVLGDQKKGTNIEAPLSTIVDAFEKVSGKTNNSNTQVTSILKLDNKTVYTQQNTYSSNRGRNKLQLGVV